MSEFPIEFINYLEMTLFGDDKVCNFFEEVVIDGIPVHMTLKIATNGYVRLILHNKNIDKKLGETIDDDEDEYLYNLLTDADFVKICPHVPVNNRCQIVMTVLNDFIRNIRFCKYTGKFIHKKNVHYAKVHQNLPNMFKNNDNIKFNTTESNKCIVCYDPTMTVTSCNHSVCIPCAINIKRDADQDVLCPMCREVMAFI